MREFDVGPLPGWQAEENLRCIRDLMERSTRHSTFSGLSGVVAGLLAFAGCAIQRLLVLPLPREEQPAPFLLNWTLVLALAIAADFILTKRRAAGLGKRLLSRLGRQIVVAAAPALGTGVLLTLYLVHRGMMSELYPFWMMLYGAAICAVGLFSQRAVSALGWSFIGAGVVTLGVQRWDPGSIPPEIFCLYLFGAATGSFHIVYGIAAARRDGW